MRLSYVNNSSGDPVSYRLGLLSLEKRFCATRPVLKVIIGCKLIADGLSNGCYGLNDTSTWGILPLSQLHLKYLGKTCCLEIA